MGVEEGNLAEPTDFYSDGVSEIDVETLFEDLYKMKVSVVCLLCPFEREKEMPNPDLLQKASPHEKSKVSPLPNLLSPFQDDDVEMRNQPLFFVINYCLSRTSSFVRILFCCLRDASAIYCKWSPM